MKILLIGSSGQLGKEIIKSSPKNINLLTPNRTFLDLSRPKECINFIKNISPDWVINSGAYTNVDKAESDTENALKVNAKGPEAIAKAISLTGGKLLHISTDYVFDGKQNTPYKSSQKISPINFYGFSKGEGESLIQNLLPANNQLCIIRTSWLMSPFGNNFATKMIKLIGDRKEIKVVYDQVSSPTTVASLANVIWKTIELNNEYTKTKRIFPKINHFSNSGIASWYDVAVALGDIGIKTGLIRKAANIIPIESDEYPTEALRPKYSVLDSSQIIKITNINNYHWREALFNTFENFRSQNI